MDQINIIILEKPAKEVINSIKELKEMESTVEVQEINQIMPPDNKSIENSMA